MPVAGDTTDALRALDHALDAPRGAGVTLGNWRWAVRQRLTVVRERLVAETLASGDYRERSDLLARLSALAPAVLQSPDAEEVRRQLKRLVVDIARHLHSTRPPYAGPHPER